MPRYQVTLILTLDADTQHEAAEYADEFCGSIEDNGQEFLPPGDSTVRPASISWPVDE